VVGALLPHLRPARLLRPLGGEDVQPAGLRAPRRPTTHAAAFEFLWPLDWQAFKESEGESGDELDAVKERPRLQEAPSDRGVVYTVWAEEAGALDVRQGPSPDSLRLGRIHSGGSVGLLDWDDRGQWRRGWLWVAASLGTHGWLRLGGTQGRVHLQPQDAKLGCLLPERRLSPEPLCLAVYENDVGQLRALVQAGLDPNVRDWRGYTPLMLAAQWGHIDCVVFLLQGGADASLLSPEGAQAAELAEAVHVRALIKALTNEDFDLEKWEISFRWLRSDAQIAARDWMMRKSLTKALDVMQSAQRSMRHMPGSKSQGQELLLQMQVEQYKLHHRTVKPFKFMLPRRPRSATPRPGRAEVQLNKLRHKTTKSFKCELARRPRSATPQAGRTEAQALARTRASTPRRPAYRLCGRQQSSAGAGALQPPPAAGQGRA